MEEKETKRKNLRPKERFEIFERDSFTCQYCGRKPDQDEVVLEIDHIVSVKDGGGNERENLITSCWDCNRGKGAKSKPKKTIKQIKERVEKEEERIEQLKEMNKKGGELANLKETSKQLSRQWIYDIVGDNMREEIYKAVEKATKKYTREKIIETLEIIVDKDIELARQWISYFYGILKRLSLSKEEGEILCMYDNILDKNCSYGNKYDWRLGNILKATQKAINNYLCMPLDFHKRVVDCVLMERQTFYGEEFPIQQETMDYLKSERKFTVRACGKHANIHILNTLISLVKQEIR